MNYKAVEVIWIFSADGRDGTGIEGSIRGPRGPKKKLKMEEKLSAAPKKKHSPNRISNFESTRRV